MKLKTALITGATSGIGKATSLALGKEGFNVILTGRNEKSGTSLAKRIRKNYKVNADFIKADISSLNEVNILSENILAF